MLRSQVCQSVLDLKHDPVYLEIGVNEGTTFHEIKAKKKVAVDPTFLFDVRSAQSKNPECEYHEVTSDQYFEALSPAMEFDVVYLDGLHTAEQTLRDLLNTLHHIKKDGVIVIDDVKPTSYAASLNSVENSNYVKSLTNDTDLSWMGDVYKLVWFIDTFMQQWCYRTVSNNHGQLIMWRSVRQAADIRQRLIQNVGNLTFEQMTIEKDVFQFASMPDIVDSIQKTQIA